MMAETISMLPVTSGSQQGSCDPCSRDSKTIECQGYCTECQENLCDACINHHRKLKLTLGHKIVKSGKLVPLMQKDATVIPKCAIHSGFEVCSFCENHDKLCCNICESVNHKNCDSVFKILDYVTKDKLDEVTSNLKTQLEDTRDAYDAVVKSKDKHTENLTKQKDDALKSISDSCTKIFNLIDKLRDRTVKKVMTCFAKATELLDNTVTDCQARSLSMDKHLKHLGTKTECINDIVRFIEIKLIKESFQKNGGPLDGNRKTQLPELEFTASNEIVDMLHNTDSLAEVGVFGEHKQLGTVKLTKNGAKRSTSVSDMAILNDGRVITCDYHHSQLVVLDSKLNYLKHYHLPFPPTGICTDKSNNVIMSHRSKLSVVSLDPSLEIKGSIDTKSAINYNGIASHGEVIYVLHDKDPVVAVYDRKGKQVCHSKTPIQSPAGIAVSPDGTWIAVSSFNENSVITFDKALKVLRKIENLSRLDGPFSLVIDAKKRMYVSVKNNVFIIMPDSQTTLLDDNNSFDGWPIVKHCKNSGKLLVVTNPWKSIAIWQP